MEQGILKKEHLDLTNFELPGAANGPFRVTELYDKYILGFDSVASRSRPTDCTIVNTENGTTTCLTTGLNFGQRTGYSICYWKDNTFVLYGGIEKVRKGTGFGSFTVDQDVHKIHLLSVMERDNGQPYIGEKHYSEIDSEWWTTNHCAHIYKDNMYVIREGQELKGDQSAIVIWKFDLDARTWSKCHMTVSRKSPGTALYGSKLYLFGGIIKEAKSFMGIPERANDLYVLDLETMTWKRRYETNFLPFLHSSEFRGDVVGDKIFITSAGFAEFVIYDIAENKVNKSEGISPAHGFMIRSFQNNSKIFRFKTPPLGDRWHLDVQDLILSSVKSDKTGSTQTQSVTIRKNILAQAPHMQLIWKDKPFADVTFVVQNEEIPAHRIILLKSHYFQTMLQSGMIESNSSKITVPDISPTSFKAILEYIYFGKVSLTEKLALDLIVLADMYFLSDLKADCETCLSTCLNVKNFLDVMKAAEIADSGKLDDKVAAFLIINLEKLNQELDFSLIPQELFVKAIRKMKLNPK